MIESINDRCRLCEWNNQQLRLWKRLCRLTEIDTNDIVNFRKFSYYFHQKIKELKRPPTLSECINHFKEIQNAEATKTDSL